MIIDPSSDILTEEEQKILRSLLINSKDRFFDNTSQWDVKVDGETKQVQLAYPILRRTSAKYKTERFEVLNPEDKLGFGAFGEVIGVLRTISLDDNRLQVKNKPKEKERIVKIQKVDRYKTWFTKVESEYKNMESAGHLHVKEPIQHENKIYMVFRRVQGISLEKFLSKKNQMSTRAQIDLCIALLQALKNQVHDKELTHGDIKDDNILIDLNMTPPDIYIIDYGLSRSHARQRKANFPKEIIDLSIKKSQKEDVMCLGPIFERILIENDFGSCKENIREFYSKIKTPNSDLRLSTDEAITELIKIKEKLPNDEKPLGAMKRILLPSYDYFFIQLGIRFNSLAFNDTDKLSKLLLENRYKLEGKDKLIEVLLKILKNELINCSEKKLLSSALSNTSTGLRKKILPLIEKSETYTSIMEDINKMPPKNLSYSYSTLSKGRYHFFEVKSSKSIGEEYKSLKGDALKTAILLDFKLAIQNIKDLKSLEEKIEEFKKNHKYEILSKSQGLITKVFGIRTSSIKAFRKICEEKKDEISGRFSIEFK